MTPQLEALQLIHLVTWLAMMPLCVVAMWDEDVFPLAMVAFAHWAIAALALHAERIGL